MTSQVKTESLDSVRHFLNPNTTDDWIRSNSNCRNSIVSTIISTTSHKFPLFISEKFGRTDPVQSVGRNSGDSVKNSSTFGAKYNLPVFKQNHSILSKTFPIQKSPMMTFHRSRHDLVYDFSSSNVGYFILISSRILMALSYDSSTARIRVCPHFV